MMEKSIIVRRSVLAAALQLEREADTSDDVTPIDLAERRIEDCEKAANKAGIRFWRAVWTHLMLVRYAPASADITVLQDDDDNRPEPDSNRGGLTVKQSAQSVSASR